MPSKPSRDFEKPVNTLFWGPLLAGAVAGLAYLHTNVGLAGSWFMLGAFAGLLGHFWGTDEVRAYRKYRAFLAANHDEERLQSLQEGFVHYPHEAIRLPLFRMLNGLGRHREAFYVIDDYALDHIDNGERWELQTLHAETLWQLGQAEKCRAVLDKVLDEAPSFLRAIEFSQEIDRQLGRTKRFA